MQDESSQKERSFTAHDSGLTLQTSMGPVIEAVSLSLQAITSHTCSAVACQGVCRWPCSTTASCVNHQRPAATTQQAKSGCHQPLNLQHMALSVFCQCAIAPLTVFKPDVFCQPGDFEAHQPCVVCRWDTKPLTTGSQVVLAAQQPGCIAFCEVDSVPASRRLCRWLRATAVLWHANLADTNVCADQICAADMHSHRQQLGTGLQARHRHATALIDTSLCVSDLCS